MATQEKIVWLQELIDIQTTYVVRLGSNKDERVFEAIATRDWLKSMLKNEGDR